MIELRKSCHVAKLSPSQWPPKAPEPGKVDLKIILITLNKLINKTTTKP